MARSAVAGGAARSRQSLSCSGRSLGLSPVSYRPTSCRQTCSWPGRGDPASRPCPSCHPPLLLQPLLPHRRPHRQQAQAAPPRHQPSLQSVCGDQERSALACASDGRHDQCLLHAAVAPTTTSASTTWKGCLVGSTTLLMACVAVPCALQIDHQACVQLEVCDSGRLGQLSRYCVRFLKALFVRLYHRPQRCLLASGPGVQR